MRQIYYFFLAAIVFCCPITKASENFIIETIASDLDHPWSIAVLSNNEFLFTEGTGRLRHVVDGKLDPSPVKGIPPVLFEGQGALSDVVLHPEFDINRYLYLSFSETDSADSDLNTLRVIRGKFENGVFSEAFTVFSATPLRKQVLHYGARMLFLPDGTLLITVGDAFNHREDAQRLDNHFGKVIRINDDGSVPRDNPYVGHNSALPEIWTYGHRNMQGLALGSDGKLIFEHEHGPKGGDELNILKPGLNYGWPAITYGIDYSGALISPFTKKKGMEQPIKHWVPSIAPSSMVFYDKDMFPGWKGSLLLSALVPGDVRRLSIRGERLVAEEVLFEHLGRVRHINIAHNGSLLMLTDGSNGKLIRVSRGDSSASNSVMGE
ncbi:MAG: PQQ-dependent sugar dehydrogenase [Cellvibrionales bacterium TMED148]|nr:glucose dehydrogenase [Porticoccaceae bacterium]RPG89258.1 MAG: PQQ-dependent sugar dehydrogenase [Cellvibrionales bacterium TMED148]